MDTKNFKLPPKYFQISSRRVLPSPSKISKSQNCKQQPPKSPKIPSPKTKKSTHNPLQRNFDKRGKCKSGKRWRLERRVLPESDKQINRGYVWFSRFFNIPAISLTLFLYKRNGFCFLSQTTASALTMPTQQRESRNCAQRPKLCPAHDRLKNQTFRLRHRNGDQISGII